MVDLKHKIKSCFPPCLLYHWNFFKKTRNFKQYRHLVEKNKELKDIHRGKRCFIIGSGTSIQKNNLKLLKDEIVFAVNNLYVHEDYPVFMQEPFAKYHVIAPIHLPQTEGEWTAWFKDMEKRVPYNVKLLLGLDAFVKNIKYIFDKNNLFQKHIKYWYYTGIIRDYNFYTFRAAHIDLTKIVWSAYAVSVYALISAIFMGFKKIYLLGMDHDYFLYNDETQMRFYKTALHQKNEFARSFGDAFYVKEFLRQYYIFSDYSLLRDNVDVEIYNASSGGILRIFPRVRYEELF